jgi:hypothetical protein
LLCIQLAVRVERLDVLFVALLVKLLVLILGNLQSQYMQSMNDC